MRLKIGRKAKAVSAPLSQASFSARHADHGIGLWQRLQCIHQNLKPFLLAQSLTYIPASPANSCHPPFSIQLKKMRHSAFKCSPSNRLHMNMLNPVSLPLPTALSSCLSVSLFYLLLKCFVVVVQVTH